MTRHDVRNCTVGTAYLQGSPPLAWIVYMYIYTDQEKWMLTTLHIYWFTRNMVLKIVGIVEQYSLFYD